ncbi:hypothetical protein [Actinomadura livida]|uniref:Uncharacterized protein n=1 Tax=Actinomadura livida TaxID=79909 RepID=A0A7W7MVX4_9ACTN|nr:MULTISPECIES: hypothetical protein [Actinomadura]MBB4772264.1 hypothetical protein [Actinomadura catellatispora]GGU28051.1 hypothetical protein GCM10010208_61180 [Actinomadura livida]
MPDTPSALARLRPARRRRPRRTLVTRTEVRVLVVPVVPEAPGTRAERLRSGAWTLYSRWEWWLAKARTDRARRAAHPYRR